MLCCRGFCTAMVRGTINREVISVTDEKILLTLYKVNRESGRKRLLLIVYISYLLLFFKLCHTIFEYC